MVGIFFICSVDFLRRGWEEERSADSLTVSNINIHEAPLTEICLMQTQTHAKLFTRNALQSHSITQLVCHLMRQIKKGQNNIVHCLKRPSRVSKLMTICTAYSAAGGGKRGFSWSPGLVKVVSQRETSCRVSKTSIKPANLTRLRDHPRLQGHKSHATEDDGDELQWIRIHFHIFLSCHISCQWNIYSSGPHFPSRSHRQRFPVHRRLSTALYLSKYSA